LTEKGKLAVRSNKSNNSGGPLKHATNASKHSIDQSKDKILQINQSKIVSKHS